MIDDGIILMMMMMCNVVMVLFTIILPVVISIILILILILMCVCLMMTSNHEPMVLTLINDIINLFRKVLWANHWLLKALTASDWWPADDENASDGVAAANGEIMTW